MNPAVELFANVLRRVLITSPDIMTVPGKAPNRAAITYVMVEATMLSESKSDIYKGG